jgi:DNA polymerase-3 subunit delta
MPAAKPFVFICGPDDFLVGRLGKERFEAMAKEAGADDFSREILSGFANNVDEVETAVNRFRDSVQTVAMFGGKRVVWFKDVNFLADTVTGRAEGTLRQVEALQEILEKVNPDEVGVIVTAAPLDRRRSFPKWCESHADFELVGGDADSAAEPRGRRVGGGARDRCEFRRWRGGVAVDEGRCEYAAHHRGGAQARDVRGRRRCDRGGACS